MFCKKCGTQITENQKFCPKCGTELGGGQQPAGTTKKKKLPIIPIIIGAVVAVLCIVLVKTLFFPGYTNVAKNYVKALEKQDPKAMLSLIPEEYIAFSEDEWDEDEDDILDTIEDMMDDMQDYFDGDIKIKYTIDDDVDDMRNREKNDVEDLWGGDFEVKEGKRIEMELEVYVDGDKEDDYDVEFYVLKIGSKWYLSPYAAWNYFWY